MNSDDLVGDLGLSAEELAALGLDDLNEQLAESLGEESPKKAQKAAAADPPLSATAPSPADAAVQAENERYQREMAGKNTTAAPKPAQKKAREPAMDPEDRLALGDIEAELAAAMQGGSLPLVGVDGDPGDIDQLDAEAAAYLKELENEELRLDQLEKGDPESGWTLSLDAAAEVLKCTSKNLAWLAVTWETEGEMGLRIVPRDVVGDARSGATVAEVRPGMPKQLKPGLVFVALNGELIINLEYDLIMQKLFKSSRPLTVQFIVHLDEPIGQ